MARHLVPEALALYALAMERGFEVVEARRALVQGRFLPGFVPSAALAWQALEPGWTWTLPRGTWRPLGPSEGIEGGPGPLPSPPGDRLPRPWWTSSWTGAFPKGSCRSFPRWWRWRWLAPSPREPWALTASKRAWSPKGPWCSSCARGNASSLTSWWGNSSWPTPLEKVGPFPHPASL